MNDYINKRPPYSNYIDSDPNAKPRSKKAPPSYSLQYHIIEKANDTSLDKVIESINEKTADGWRLHQVVALESVGIVQYLLSKKRPSPKRSGNIRL